MSCTDKGTIVSMIKMNMTQKLLIIMTCMIIPIPRNLLNNKELSIQICILYISIYVSAISNGDLDNFISTLYNATQCGWEAIIQSTHLPHCMECVVTRGTKILC